VYVGPYSVVGLGYIGSVNIHGFKSKKFFDADFQGLTNVLP
jgi:hypothetical protein